ncbi:hypothetical protein DYB32_002496 [Aphanomyces invadans]|uniref:Alpha-type protein kinase domain-containing protein n=1 Tax=Aphanomyces invadans TaxID=157072 RepID=A0A3R6WQF1_9STRA|nr:hypothetical protein DYB32_002496 [Aphanomyces invadans]
MASHRCRPTSAAEATERNVCGAIASDKTLADALSATSIEGSEVAIQAIRSTREKAVAIAIHSVRPTRDMYLAFLMDTTGSMGRHILSVKQQISALVASIAGLGPPHTFVAFVGYKDHCDGADRIDVLPFTTDVAYFERHVQSVQAKGGGDVPEDVLGGLFAAVSQLPWPQDTTNVLFHIGDAPPHGRRFYHGRDSYPDGHKSDKPLHVLFGLLGALKIQYQFGQVDEASTREMVAAFQAACLDAGVPMAVFDVTDPVHIAASVSSGAAMSTRLSSVASEEHASAGRVGSTSGGLAPELPRRRSMMFCPHPPNWSTLALVRASVVSYVPPTDVDSLVAGTMDTMVRPITLRVAPHPFAFGSDRVVYFAQEYHKLSVATASTESSMTTSFSSWTDVAHGSTSATEAAYTYQVEDMVAKSFLDGNADMCGGAAEGCRYMQAMECQRLPRSDAIKLTNNVGYVCDVASAADAVNVAMAFSHWTWQVTKKKLMVVDLQGCRTTHGLVLTDPAVHCVDLERYNCATNLGRRGMDTFFASHQCKSICHSLQLAMP